MLVRMYGRVYSETVLPRHGMSLFFRLLKNNYEEDDYYELPF
jgi:hypothetical protein